MKILIVGLVANSQLKRLQEEGEKRGHQIDGCLSADLIIKAGPNQFKILLKDKNILDYNLVYLWAFAKRRWEWSLAAQYLNQRHQIKIVNQKVITLDYRYYLTPASDYLQQTENGLRYPKSVFLFSSSQVDEVVNDFEFPLILKISGSRQGKGVFKIDSLDELKKTLKKFEERVKNQASAFVIREYLPNEGDIRVFTVGFKAIGAMKRLPKPGDFRSNISQGGSGSNFDLKKAPEVKQMAEKISQLTRTEIAGVDIMIHQETKQPYVLEINPGPQFTGLEKYTPTNVALEIIKYFENLVG